MKLNFDLKGFEAVSMPEFDIPEFNFFPGAVESSKNSLNHDDYRSLITGSAWRKIRNKVVAERKNCEWCGSDDRLEVHHLSYDQTGEDPEYDLVLLCLRCHRKAHTKADWGRSYMHEDRWLLEFELQLEELSKSLNTTAI